VGSSLLVVTGEASGDRAAAAVVARLPGVRAFGLGGAALREQDVELLGDLRRWTALGFGEAAARAGGVVAAWRAVQHAVRERRPEAALLVNYTEYNARLAPRLHALGVRVLWYGAPQVWAWRPQRAHSLRRGIDRMAVMLPFEEDIWRSVGVDAHYVGHPAMEVEALARGQARAALGMTPYAATVAILPGSRPHEVRRLLAPMLDAFERVRADRASVDARVLVASSLDENTRSRVRDACAARRVLTYDVDPRVGAMRVLRAFDVALCASGTASLEAALAHAVPVVAYRVGVTTELVARALLRTKHVALPNVLLGRPAFAELLQREAHAGQIAEALAHSLDRRSALIAECVEVARALGPARTPSVEVARMIAPWLGVRAAA
jgi:lipid-A-disaccharide synthase